MNKIPEWNHEKPDCFMCEETELKQVKLKFNDNTYDSTVCSRCRAVYVPKEGEMFYMGFLPEEEWIRVLTSKDPVINVSVKKPIDPILN